MTERPVIGLVLAFIVEARHWTSMRWEFDDDTSAKVWQFCSIATALASVLIWLDGNRHTALPNLLSWMPPLLVPMQFVQTYGMRDSLSLGIYSFLARQRRARNRRLGLIEEMPEFNFGNVYFAVILVAATVGTASNTRYFLPGIVTLTAWMFLKTSRSGPITLFPVFVVSGLLALAGQYGLSRAEEWLGMAASSRMGLAEASYNQTSLGKVETVTQSPEILWRLKPKERTSPPPLLRRATYNTLLGTTWQIQRVSSVDFKPLDSILIGNDPHWLLLPTTASARIPSLPSFSLRGAAFNESFLPLPGDAASLRDFELDGVEGNSFGTVRVYPKHAVISGTVFWKGATNPEGPPFLGDEISATSEDLRIPLAEQAEPARPDERGGGPPRITGGAIHQCVGELHLDELPTLDAKLNRMRAWFHQNFQYTRKLTIRSPDSHTGKPTAISQFLTKVRAGHCEYFASAATLMLRDAGIPTRYAVGFAIVERDPGGEYIIRGTHSHAWCRVWDEGRKIWIDFDPTPPDWMSVLQMPRLSFLQRFNDRIKLFREDFFIWRNQPNNRLAVSLVMLAVGLALGGFVFRRLWRSKRRIGGTVTTDIYQGPTVRTPLHELEARARRHLGERPAGQPFGVWLGGLRSAMADPAALDEAIALHQRMRFDPQPAPPVVQARLLKLAEILDARLRTLT